MIEKCCDIYICTHNEKNLCCADCVQKDCPDRCLNSPEKCGCLNAENWRE